MGAVRPATGPRIRVRGAGRVRLNGNHKALQSGRKPASWHLLARPGGRRKCASRTATNSPPCARLSPPRGSWASTSWDFGPSNQTLVDFVSSVHGVSAARKRNMYAVTKAGLIPMARNMATEFAPQNVRVISFILRHSGSPALADGAPRFFPEDPRSLHEQIHPISTTRPDWTWRRVGRQDSFPDGRCHAYCHGDVDHH